MKVWIVLQRGDHDCGEEDTIIGVYADESVAESIAAEIEAKYKQADVLPFEVVGT